MAVFSKVTQETLQNLLSNFNIGELLYFEGIQAGIENTNYFIYTSEDTYVLTIFEKLTFISSVMGKVLILKSSFILIWCID